MAEKTILGTHQGHIRRDAEGRAVSWCAPGRGPGKAVRKAIRLLEARQKSYDQWAKGKTAVSRRRPGSLQTPR